MNCLRKDNGEYGVVIFASLQSILSKRYDEIRRLLAKTADLVVIDEIHNFISNRGNDFINEIGEQARVLKAIYIYFNNDAEAFAVRNAVTLRDYLETLKAEE